MALHANSRMDAEVNDIVRTLRSHGVLSNAALKERVGAERWRAGDPTFEEALRRAERQGRVRCLGQGFYELSEEERLA